MSRIQIPDIAMQVRAQEAANKKNIGTIALQLFLTRCQEGDIPKDEYIPSIITEMVKKATVVVESLKKELGEV